MARNIKAKNVLIKIGTNTLTNNEGDLDNAAIKNIVNQIADIKKKGKNVVLVTSGAIGAGMKELNLKSKPQDITMRQVCAAVGQSILMDTYQSLFGKHNIKIAQILLTYSDFSNQKVFSNFQKGISKMLEMGIVPIINENDPISIDEIGPSFGDNDMLSAMIATSLDIQLLLILTNVDGLFDRNPKENGAVLINEIGDIEKCKKYVDDKGGCHIFNEGEAWIRLIPTSKETFAVYVGGDNSNETEKAAMVLGNFNYYAVHGDLVRVGGTAENPSIQ